MYSDTHSLEELLSLQQKVKDCSIEIVASELRALQNQEALREEAIERQRREQEERKKAEDAMVLERSKESKTGAPWQLEEDHCLSQAIKKYPAGYRNRWGKIAEYVTEYSRCNRERTDVQCRARIEEITRRNMGQNTKVDDNGAFARFQRGKELFKEKNKVEIQLDTNYSSVAAVVKEEEKMDENGWTQSQQKALEAFGFEG
ncbi:hypothetical protein JH06_4546 [Blastocystis sp. subtype 4]|uniref:hypothetical protein n=1 Tax=Blastocystis sp. subtype 4 TaxID=944170 RepID=UPI000711D8F0|nr:hypothetical protein JH06_4546 [Blastocystis sp. subtype 4]KNB41957.1 hypothetical protein JH06_4546 [Blastocystis sp. subtype 4]|eukprot:XP_014525400.1 hypothetical protein JH06_4546 [Blastocystis sp. subtype 4]